ncbi:MAG: hypothetical protein HYS21_01795 [Deltaproteobacteria bacterium]|nr:hypothetical protein [Deltaproteobacteria bacterium]
MRHKDCLVNVLIPAVILALLSFIYISPIFSNFSYIGLSDWDSQLFYYAAPLKTILEYHQFPLWNPYACGGMPMLASPELSFLAPPYIFPLLFGEVAGVKFQIIFYTIIGMWGMYFLSRTLGFGRYSSFAAPIIFMLSSWYPLRISEGHSGFMPFALLPLVAAFYIRANEAGSFKIRPLILSAVFLAWMLLAGGVYPFTVTSLFLFFFSILSAVSKKSVRPLINVALIVVFTFLLGAVKAIPQYEFISQYPRKTETTEYHSVNILKDSLFSRNQRVTTQSPEFYKGAQEDAGEYLRAFWRGERPWGWQEYGAFVGIGAFILYLLGFAFIKRLWVWLSISVITLLLSMGDYSPINLWTLLRKLPVFGSLHGPSRITILFVFTLSVIAGFVVNRLESADALKKKLPSKALVIPILLILLLELITVSMPVFKDAFVKPPYNLQENKIFSHIIVNDPTAVNYPYFLQNVGVLNCYESQHPTTKAVPYGHENGDINPYYKGEAYLANGQGTANLKFFSPNKAIIEVDATAKDTVVFNQNFFNGWRKEYKGQKSEVTPFGGLVASEVEAGRSEVTFYYSPTSFRVGLGISVVSLIIAGFFIFRRPKECCS